MKKNGNGRSLLKSLLKKEKGAPLTHEELVDQLKLARKAQTAVRRMAEAILAILEHEQKVLDQFLKKLGAKEEKEDEE